ncbi:hypothetical protein L0P10_18730, partial [Eggerthella lenta]|nr:hypothetical protein [Eggerthella lenta]
FLNQCNDNRAEHLRTPHGFTRDAVLNRPFKSAVWRNQKIEEWYQTKDKAPRTKDATQITTKAAPVNVS